VRSSAVDGIKATATLAVILIHSLHPWFLPGISQIELWIGQVTRFAVPAFLFCSAFLYASRPDSESGGVGSTVRQRLQRLLIPYGIASVLALLGRAILSEPPSLYRMVADLAIGSAYGPYYYVLVLCLFILTVPLFRLASMRVLLVLIPVSIGIQSLFEIPGLSPIPFNLGVHLRNPFLWMPYFVLGWMAGLYADSVSRFAEQWRTILLAVLIPVTGALYLHTTVGNSQISDWVAIFPTVALLYCAFSGVGKLPGFVVALSSSSYLFYLYHLFFVDYFKLALSAWGVKPSPLTALACWVVAVSGSVGVLLAVRRLPGTLPRRLFGA